MSYIHPLVLINFKIEIFESIVLLLYLRSHFRYSHWLGVSESAFESVLRSVRIIFNFKAHIFSLNHWFGQYHKHWLKLKCSQYTVI